jgi:hypothetical protein
MTICNFFKSRYNSFTRTATLIATLPLIMYALAGCAQIPEGSKQAIQGSNYSVAVNTFTNLNANRDIAWGQARILEQELGDRVDEVCRRYDKNENGFIEDEEFIKILHEELGATGYRDHNGRVTLTR